MLDAQVNDRLRKERQDELQQAPYQQSQGNLHEAPAVLLQVTKKEAERVYAFRLFPFQLTKFRGRFQEHGDSFFLPLRGSAHPMLFKFFPAVSDFPFARVGDVEGFPSPYFIEHHEMVLVPVEDARKRSL